MLISSLKYSVFLFILFGTFCSVNSQTTISYKGIILDFASKSGIPFVHFIDQKNQGFISDEKGQFLFVTTSEHVLVKASAMGYETKSFILTKNSPKTLYLKRVVYDLQEVVVNYTNKEKELLKKVIERIPVNYPDKKERLVGKMSEETYWDSLYKKPIYKAEVSTVADKFSYTKKNNHGSVKIHDKKLEIFDADLGIRFYAGVHNVHRFDLVMQKNGVLNRNNLEQYEISIKDTIYFDDNKVVQLEFKGKKDFGTLFIALESYALLRFEHETKKPYLEDKLLSINSYKRILSRYRIDYGQYKDGKWRIKFIHYTTAFKHRKKEKKFYLKNTYAIQKVSKEAIKIPINERFPYKGILTDAIVSDSTSLVFLKNNAKMSSKFLRFLSRISFSINFDYLSVNSNTYRFSILPLGLDFEKVSGLQRIPVLSYMNEYSLTNTTGITFESSKALQNKTYEAMAVGPYFKNEISKRGRWWYQLNGNIGFRNLRHLSEVVSFSEKFKVGQKTFDSGKVALYGEQQEWFFSPGFQFYFHSTPNLKLGFGVNYFIPIRIRTGIFIQEKNEFWFWNRSKRFQKGVLDFNGDQFLENRLKFRLSFGF